MSKPMNYKVWDDLCDRSPSQEKRFRIITEYCKTMQYLFDVHGIKLPDNKDFIVELTKRTETEKDAYFAMKIAGLQTLNTELTLENRRLRDEDGLLKRIQREQKDWYDRQPWATESDLKLGQFKFFEPLAGVTEEVGELSHSLLKQFQGIRGTYEEHEENAKNAVGDIIIYLMSMCNHKHWDIQDILLDVWKEVSARDWNRNKNNGNSKT